MPTIIEPITEAIVIKVDRVSVAGNPAIVEMLFIIVAKIKPMMIWPIPSGEVPLIVDGVAKTKTVIVSPTTKIQPTLT